MSRSLESSLSFRVRRPRGYVVNKGLDLINGLLYTLPQSLSVDVLQIPYRNRLSVPQMRRLVHLFLHPPLILGGHPPKPGFWGP
jgi:hypothetical protein